MAIVGWLLLEYFAYMCKCEALNDTQLFPIIHQWSGFSLGRRLSLCVVAVCMVSAGLEVVAAVCVITSPNCLHIDQVALISVKIRLYHSIKWCWLDWSNFSQLIQLIYLFCFPVDPNNTYKLNQSTTPPKLTFLKMCL